MATWSPTATSGWRSWGSTRGRRPTTRSGDAGDWSARGWRKGPSGLSTGLDYIPSRYADAREIAALCEAIAPDDGVYVTHMRGYGPHVPAAWARSARSPGGGRRRHVSHYNGPADLLLPLMDQGRVLAST